MVTYDVLREARERLVDRVVDDFVNEVMQAADAGVADVHAGAFADRFEAFEDLDLVRGVIAGFDSLTGSLSVRRHGFLLILRSIH